MSLETEFDDSAADETNKTNQRTEQHLSNDLQTDSVSAHFPESNAQESADNEKNV